MQLKNKILMIVFTAAIFASCKKLEIKPKGFVDPAVAIQTEQDVKDALNAAYNVIRDDNFLGGNISANSELLADLVDGNALAGDRLGLFKLLPVQFTDANHNQPYTVIQRANNAIENIGLVTSSNAAKNNVEGQAKFVRALSYFELVKIFAQPWGYTADNSHLGLVIKTKSSLENGLPRSSVRAVYDLIISDLKSAETLLPNINGNYPGAIAAKALLARVYFQQNDFANAYKYANDVITLGLANGIVFDNAATFAVNRFSNPKSTESIFWIVNEAGLSAAFGPLRNNANLDQSMGLTIVKSAFDNGTAIASDNRRIWYKDSLITGTSTHIYSVRKYNHPSFILPVIHLTEMKLIRAESAAELNTNLTVAITDINDIITRAYGNTTFNLASNATAAAIRTKVRAERRLELVFESGDRLQQIKRIGAKGEPSLSRTAPWNCNGLILQFPANEIIVNTNFVQNPTGSCL
jgi:starch-binding outer membrane protein, SusD/RagB family